MANVLVVGYSYTGTTRRLAQLLASHNGWPMGEIQDAQSRAGGAGTLRCVLDSLLRRHPRIRYLGPDPEGFETVVLLAPIWMVRLAGPMRSFVADHREQLKRVAVICTMSSGGATNAFGEIAQLLGHEPIACTAFLQREVDEGTCTGRLLDFAQMVQSGVAGTSPERVAALRTSS